MMEEIAPTFPEPSESDRAAIIAPISQIRKLRFSEVK